MRTQPVLPQAFHVGRFGEDYNRVHEKLRRHFEKCRFKYSIEGNPIMWVQLDTTPDRWLTTAIANQLTRACLVIADITPIDTAAGLSWNPNVMHELGRADQLQVPTFRICDVHFRTRAAEVPFDIRTCPVFWYERSCPGIEKLCQLFASWYDANIVASYYHAQPFLEIARSIRSEVLQWPVIRSPQFRVALAQWMLDIQRRVSSVSEYLLRGSNFDMDSPSAEVMIDAFLAETFKTLRSGDEYLTFSNPAFLVSLATYPSRFHEEVLARTGLRDVTVRRMVLIGKQEEIADSTRKVMEEHDRLAKRLPGYEIRYAESPEDEGHRDPRHCGVFLWGHGKKCQRVLFKPRYEKHDGRVVLVGLEYHEHVSAHLERFETAWKHAGKGGVSDFLARVQ